MIMKKNFLKSIVLASLMLAMTFCVVGCRSEHDTAYLETKVQNAIKEVLNTEQINISDTVLSLNHDDTNIKINGLETDSTAAGIDDPKRPIYVKVYANQGMDIDGHTLVDILAVIFIFGSPMLIFFFLFFFLFRYLYKVKCDRNRVIEFAIKNNAKVDPIIFSNYKTPRTRLHSALVWVAWGAGIMLFFYCVGADEVIGLGAVPLFVGIAKLITYFVEDRKQRPEIEKDQNIDAE